MNLATFLVAALVAAVFLAIALEVLLGAALHSAIHRLGFTLVGEVSALNHKEVLAVVYDLRIDGVDTATAEGEIVNGVKNICLTNTIVSDKTIDLRR